MLQTRPKDPPIASTNEWKRTHYNSVLLSKNEKHLIQINFHRNKYESHIDQELADAAAYAPADASYSLTRWQHFVAWNWRHGRQRQLESITTYQKFDSVNPSEQYLIPTWFEKAEPYR